MTREEVLEVVSESDKLDFKDLKISYLILKPNAARHYKVILNEIEKQQYTIIGQYAIRDYETLNMALHIEQPEAMKYIIPISRFYNDFYGNYGVLLLIGKQNITYPNFCLQVVALKHYLRARFKCSYIAQTFNISELGCENKHQKLMFLDKEGNYTENGYFKDEGTFMVFYINEVHSPDEDISTLVKEFNLLDCMGLISLQNAIPRKIIEAIKKYKTFEYIKDMY